MVSEEEILQKIATMLKENHELKHQNQLLRAHLQALMIDVKELRAETQRMEAVVRG